MLVMIHVSVRMFLRVYKVRVFVESVCLCACVYVCVCMYVFYLYACACMCVVSVSLFNGISTLLGYLMPKPFS